MGLIKAALGAAGGTLADQWKEFFYCEALDKDTLVTKGVKKTSGRSSNTKGNDNIISNGSGIAVADGQCMIIVEQGKIVEFCAEPGEFTFDTSSEPSIFTGGFGEGIKNTFHTMLGRFTYGGDTGKDQRIYYFNTKEILDNKFGTPNPIMFRVVDQRVALDLDVSVRCSGTYTYKIVDPILFYTNVCGNVAQDYQRSEIDNQLKTEFVSALQPAFNQLSALGLRPSELPGHTPELESAMNTVLTEKWQQLRGLKVINVAISTLNIPEEDMEAIKKAQRTTIYSDPGRAGGAVIDAVTSAVGTAAGNENGAMAGIMGMGMTMNSMGALNPAGLFAMNQQQTAQQQAAPAADAWKCPGCGAVVSGNFCPQCGAKKPADDSWTCPSCGQTNKGNFCSNCGTGKPQAAAQYQCSKCGWKPENPQNPPKFCPQCGKPFGPEDIVK